MARRKELPPDEKLDALRDDLKWRPPPRPREALKMGSVIANLMARRGYAQVEESSERETGWQEVVGPALGPQTRSANIRRGVMEVIVASSAVMQELTFRKSTLLKQLAQRLPSHKIKDLRFRLGAVK